MSLQEHTDFETFNTESASNETTTISTEDRKEPLTIS